jgi:hypothetical protein
MTLRPAIALLLLAGCSRSEPPVVTAPMSSASSASASAPAPSADVPAASASSAVTDARDPIARLVARLSASPMWNNGGFSRITLPPSATAAQVLAEVFKNISFDQGPVTRHKILEERKVHIGNDGHDYTAVRVDTNFGPRVALISYWGPSTGWWSRVFDEE